MDATRRRAALEKLARLLGREVDESVLLDSDATDDEEGPRPSLLRRSLHTIANDPIVSLRALLDPHSPIEFGAPHPEVNTPLPSPLPSACVRSRPSPRLLSAWWRPDATPHPRGCAKTSGVRLHATATGRPPHKKAANIGKAPRTAYHPPPDQFSVLVGVWWRRT